MTRTATNNVVQVQPQANVYTILILVAVVILAVALGVVLHTLLADSPAGYGLNFGDLFGPLKLNG